MKSILFFALTFFFIAAQGCDDEEDFNGRWQLTQGCELMDDCDGFVYELNLAHYGSNVTGIVVRYINRGIGNSFERTSECGCFFIQAGRITNKSLRFQLYRPDQPGPPMGATASTACDPMPAECSSRIFTLNKVQDNSDKLVAILRCGEDDRDPRKVIFTKVVGERRTICDIEATTPSSSSNEGLPRHTSTTDSNGSIDEVDPPDSSVDAQPEGDGI